MTALGDSIRIMRLGAAFVIVLAAATAFADDDPDLPVLTGRIADDAPGDVRLTLTRRVARSPFGWQPAKFHRRLTVAPGGAFRFAGLPPCPYDLVVEGEGLARQELTFDICTDVTDVAVRPVRAIAPATASLSGKLTLGFEGATNDCEVSIDLGGTEVRGPVGADGSFTLDGLRAGTGWVTFGHPRLRVNPRPNEILPFYSRQVPCVLRPGANRLDLRLDPDEDVRLVLRPSVAGETIEGYLTDLDPAPHEPWGERIRVDCAEDGSLSAYRCVTKWIDSFDFHRVGSDFRLRASARGAHRIRIEAAGYDTVERSFEVAGPTRVDVEMPPLPGEYVLPQVSGDYWFVEERAADSSWTPVFTWDRRSVSSHEPPRAEPCIFLTPGVHVLRAVSAGAPPSEALELKAGTNRARRSWSFHFPKGARLTGWLVTPQSAKDTKVLGGFEVHVFRLVEKRWEPLRAQQTHAADAFEIHGLAPGRHRLAFDAEGKHVFAEFDMGDEDVEREFTFRCR